jgi:hypothetical protein
MLPRLRIRFGPAEIPREVKFERARAHLDTESIAWVAAVPPSQAICLDRATSPLTSDQIVSRCPGALNIGTGPVVSAPPS